MVQLGIIFFLLIITNAIGTFAYAARLAGVRSGSINNSATLYNAMTLFSRLANMFMLPLIGVIVEKAIKTGDITSLTWDFRILILASSVGIVVAMILIPTMSDILYITILKLKEHRSLVKVFRKEAKVSKIKTVFKMFRFPRKGSIKRLSVNNLPKHFLIINLFAYSLYTVGFLSALYSGALMPEYRLVASNLSSAINGFATISLYILVDPILNVISDEVMDEDNPRTEHDLTSTIFFLSLGRFFGSIFAQVIFIPTAWLIVWVSQLFI